MKPIHFSWQQKLILLFSSINPCKWLTKKLKRKDHKTELYKEIFELGSEKVKNDLNMYTMLETIMKLKAAVTVLVGNNNKQLKKI